MQTERVIWGIFPVNVELDSEDGCNIDGFWADIITDYLLHILIVNWLFIVTEQDEYGFEWSAFKFYPYSVNKKKTWLGMMWALYLSPFKKTHHRDN